MKRKIAFLILFLVIISFDGITLAVQPKINDIDIPTSFSHKQTVSLSGVDFGLKSPAKPLRYEDFEDGINGEQVPSTESSGGLEATTGIVYDDTYQRFPGAQNAQQNFNNGIYNQEMGLNEAESITSSKLYMHGYWRMDRHGAITRNAKFLNLGLEFGSGNWASRVDFGSSDGNEYTQITLTLKPGCPAKDVMVEWGSESDARKVMGDDDEWHRIDSYIDLHGGYRNLYIDNELIMEVRSTDMTVGCSDESIGYVYFGHYYTNDSFSPTPEAERWWDEIYIDTTQARVELCDSPQWSSRSHCEIQIPSDWSDSSITFTINQGSFLETDTAYLYVIDAEGNVSNDGQGVAITIGGGTPPPPPNENDPTFWSAVEQTLDSTWSDSGVTYCVRLLVKGTN
ncbi:MAG: hypothetical protein D3908_07045, partial [Candidatus Electrothrix sp. AUS4]|nr:hypothetical protein [Candidatus Electrothrix sp. AUS4]